jgi:hypothetical protein
MEVPPLFSIDSSQKRHQKWEEDHHCAGPWSKECPGKCFPMIYPSFNAHGVGGAPKFLPLKRLVKSCSPNVIMIQETMCFGSKAVETFSPWLKDWSFSSVNSVGLSGGLLTTWNPHLKVPSTSSLNSSIVVDLEDRILVDSFHLINIYNPYSKKRPYWEVLASPGILSASNIILGGDLNFTLSIREVWGAHPRRNPLEGFFAHLIEEAHLVDFEPPNLTPTWRNGRKGEDGVTKFLDRYLIFESLLNYPWLIKSRVASGVSLIIYRYY